MWTPLSIWRISCTRPKPQASRKALRFCLSIKLSRSEMKANLVSKFGSKCNKCSSHLNNVFYFQQRTCHQRAKTLLSLCTLPDRRAHQRAFYCHTRIALPQWKDSAIWLKFILRMYWLDSCHWRMCSNWWLRVFALWQVSLLVIQLHWLWSTRAAK